MLIPDPFWTWMIYGSPYTGILKREVCQPRHPKQWEVWNENGEIQRIEYWTGRTYLSVGWIYPVQLKIGQPPVGWVRLRAIKQSSIRLLTPEDVRAQGFASLDKFYSYYKAHYGKQSPDSCYLLWLERLFLARPETWRSPSRS